MTTVLITRPRAQAEVFARVIEREGFQPIVAPVLEIKAVGYEEPDLKEYDGLVFTSVNGVLHFRHVDTDMKVFAVGRQTKQALQDLGYSDIACAEGSARDLEKMLDNGTYLHIRGVDAAREFGPHVRGLVAYKAEMIDRFDDDVVQKFKRKSVDCVGLFSVRTAQNFKALIEKAGLDDDLKSVSLLSISDDVLKCVRTLNWKNIYVADVPDREGMVRTLRGIYKI